MEKLAQMDLSALAEHKFACLCGKNHAAKAHVLYGDASESLKAVLEKIAPMSKAALLCTRDAFYAEGERWMRAVRNAGATPLNVILAKKRAGGHRL